MQFLIDNNNKREKSYPIGGKAVKLPIYFPSISTVKTGKTKPLAYFRILQALSPHFLVSAYDIYNSKDKDIFIQELKENKEQKKAIIILDSGNYERFWLKDKGWTQTKFNSIVKENICEHAFCFDKLNPGKMESDNEWLKKSIAKSQNMTSASSIIPIVHSAKPESFPEIVLALHKKINFSTIAIPERELGDGIVQRTETITKLRKALSVLDRYIYIHVLGTGNPLTLLLFSLAGADTFDGLEWCQTVVDVKTSLLYHFQQRELIMDDCFFCNNGEFDYNLKTFAHNLQFFNSWMLRVQEAINMKTCEELLKQYFSESIINQLDKLWS
jgi:hypothetical protein